MIPTLRTERLTLRGWQKSDFSAFATFWSDPERTRHFLSGTLDQPAAWTMFTAMVGEWHMNGMGSLAIETTEGDVVGYTGLWKPVDIDEPELLWSLYAGGEGKGFATEAARAVQIWAAETLRLKPLMSFVHPDNGPSIAVAERLGATLEDRTTLRGSPRLVYRHIDPTIH